MYTSDGTYIDPESSNFPQTRACARCRSYKYRLYHPGRLLYPLKQTKKRGDLSGFKRITWEQAIQEIAAKHKAVIDTFGVDGIYSIYAWGAATGTFQGASGGPLGAGGAGGNGGAALRYMGGAQSSYFGSYSTHQYRYLGVKYTGADENANVNSVSKYAKHVVLWGDNNVSTANPYAYGYVKFAEALKARSNDNKIVFIGPEFSDGAVVVADEWYAAKPYTDPALVAGIIYYMLENTFDLTTGALKENPMLDIDYLDTMVYGFFDSPKYWVNNATGEISTTEPADLASGDYREVPEVPAGKSYCSWILGNNDNAQTYSQLGAASNYTASKFGNVKRWAPCSYTVTAGTATKYKTKQDFQKPKNAEWCTPITGVSAASIEAIAKIYADGPVTSTWSGGMQKQHDGIANLYAVQALHVITKNVGRLGAGFVRYITPNVTADPNALVVNVVRPNNNNYVNNTKAEASCTAWHTAIKMAFADIMSSSGYTHKYIPNYDKGTDTTPNVYWDDGGTKTFIQWRRDNQGNLKTYTDDNGNTFYDWEGRTSTAAVDTDTAEGHAAGTPKYTGIRLMYNTGGNIFINQHENSNDSREMLETLPLNDGTANTFCLVSFDNFMSPTPRWSDYVLPAATSWEQQDIITPYHGSNIYIPQVITPPGESKPTWDFANELVKAYAGQTAATDFTGGVANQTVEALVKKSFNEARANTSSPYYGMTWDEFIANVHLPSKPDNDTIAQPVRKAVIDNYNNANKMLPFIKPNVADYFVDTNEVTDGGYGNQFANTSTAPKSPRRFQVYSPVLVWQYENKFSMWHGYLPEEQRGQKHKDYEGDDIVLPLPIYYAYEDYFMEAYGLFNDYTSSNDIHNNYPYVLTTTHDRYRSHSSMAENPLLRELTHKVPGKRVNPNTYMPFEYKEDELKQGNDYGYYAEAPANAFSVNGSGDYPVLNSTINADGTVNAENKEIASYNEIWMSKSVADAVGVANGDLVDVYNPIGKVRCVAKISRRCASGFVGIHQGCWYDPRDINGETVDVGGNCNTLMASQPSRIDHGNGQQSAMVQIVKVTNY